MHMFIKMIFDVYFLLFLNKHILYLSYKYEKFNVSVLLI